MQTIVLEGKSKTDLKLLADLARKLGIKVKYLSKEEKEEIGLISAIEQGSTGEYVDTDEFIKKLRN
jgi:transcriptional regulator with XRE-family HTH domain